MRRVDLLWCQIAAYTPKVHFIIDACGYACSKVLTIHSSLPACFINIRDNMFIGVHSTRCNIRDCLKYKSIIQSILFTIFPIICRIRCQIAGDFKHRSKAGEKVQVTSTRPYECIIIIILIERGRRGGRGRAALEISPLLLRILQRGRRSPSGCSRVLWVITRTSNKWQDPQEYRSHLIMNSREDQSTDLMAIHLPRRVLQQELLENRPLLPPMSLAAAAQFRCRREERLPPTPSN